MVPRTYIQHFTLIGPTYATCHEKSDLMRRKSIQGYATNKNHHRADMRNEKLN